ncbi:M15 family metallopeptidase [Galbibacter sp. EGI 63066]|uniref:M15 family metallopeptidase n=1 Tax=Galbibacter sp. EGI 63066 TaxID=2993559 RepID=UPI002248E8F0|nr:M15 family metallopeptidase [Galbibacter sp. EGI 63066]MCX2680399.1 M15 family metallopeptidase [Galbibacter sp. EGI 63066]
MIYKRFLFGVVLCLLCFSAGNVVAQETYSEAILIGKGTPDLHGEGIGLQKEAYDAFLKMRAAAKKEGIEIKVVSGYRNFNRQKAIFERKYKRYTADGLSPEAAIDKIVEYSTIPGTSRHHWGTDIDIIDNAAGINKNVLDPDKFVGNGPFCELREWLEEHANSFGFYIVYTDAPDRKGFKYEPWHYSYAPISKPMLRAYKKLDVKSILVGEQLLGSEHLSSEFMEAYIKNNILDINPELKD